MKQPSYCRTAPIYKGVSDPPSNTALNPSYYLIPIATKNRRYFCHNSQIIYKFFSAFAMWATFVRT